MRLSVPSKTSDIKPVDQFGRRASHHQWPASQGRMSHVRGPRANHQASDIQHDKPFSICEDRRHPLLRMEAMYSFCIQ